MRFLLDVDGFARVSRRSDEPLEPALPQLRKPQTLDPEKRKPREAAVDQMLGCGLPDRLLVGRDARHRQPFDRARNIDDRHLQLTDGLRLLGRAHVGDHAVPLPRPQPLKGGHVDVELDEHIPVAALLSVANDAHDRRIRLLIGSQHGDFLGACTHARSSGRGIEAWHEARLTVTKIRS